MMGKDISDEDWLRKLRDGYCLKAKCETCNNRCHRVADRLESLAEQLRVARAALEAVNDPDAYGFDPDEPGPQCALGPDCKKCRAIRLARAALKEQSCTQE